MRSPICARRIATRSSPRSSPKPRQPRSSPRSKPASPATRTCKKAEQVADGRDDHYNVTMVATKKQMAAGEFKAKCLQVMDQVAKDGRPVVLTKRGKPVVRIVPVEEPKPDA